ncbi:hypothetical protein N9S62_04480 [Pelagibacteraceae bacterium]|nr:hypothetical protein [Pelagibacteraceae bacterium]
MADKLSDVIKRIKSEKLPFKVKEEDYLNLSNDIAANLRNILSNIKFSEGLSWCISTIKKAKVFTLIYQASAQDKEIYKEEIAKKLPEYSYKTIASIIDEGIEKGFYVTTRPDSLKIKDGKIKNIRPSKEVSIDFINWNFNRIIETNKLIKKYKS